MTGPYRLLRRTLGNLPGLHVQVPLRVRSGLSQGLWIWTRLPEEAAYWRGKHDRFAEAAIAGGVRPGAVVYDVGAHIGTLALAAARLVGERGAVVAFEADPDTVSTLRRNCFWNRLQSRVQVVHAAVWSYSSPDGIMFRRGKDRRSHGGVEADGWRPVRGGGRVVRTPVVSLDDFAGSTGPRPDLVKIDVEGGEYEVLCGGEGLFTGRRPLLIVEVHHEEASTRIRRWLKLHCYRARWQVPEQGFPRLLQAWPSEAGGGRFV